MKNTKSLQTSLFKEAGFAYSTAPKTHVFYEAQGERSIDPLLMIKDGITLWREQILLIVERDLRHLWAYAQDLLADRRPTDAYSYVEKLRHDITLGTIIPEKWDRRRAYPYKGLLISAVYFQEAKRLCEEGNADRAWHIVTMAYYHLGMNTPPLLAQAASKRAIVGHDRNSIFKRDFVLKMLEKVKRDGSAGNVKQAIDKIYELICDTPGATKLLDDIEVHTSKRPKSAHEDADAAAIRLHATLKKWAHPDGPYPEIIEAFAYFDKSARRSEPVGPDHEDISWESLPENSAHYMRFILYEESGLTTLQVQENSEEELEVEQKNSFGIASSANMRWPLGAPG